MPLFLSYDFVQAHLPATSLAYMWHLYRVIELSFYGLAWNRMLGDSESTSDPFGHFVFCDSPRTFQTRVRPLHGSRIGLLCSIFTLMKSSLSNKWLFDQPTVFTCLSQPVASCPFIMSLVLAGISHQPSRVACGRPWMRQVKDMRWRQKKNTINLHVLSYSFWEQILSRAAK